MTPRRTAPPTRRPRETRARTPAPLVLPADGSTVWRLTVPGRGHRWLRPRKNGPGYLVPAGWAAARCPYGEPPVEPARSSPGMTSCGGCGG